MRVTIEHGIEGATRAVVRKDAILLLIPSELLQLTLMHSVVVQKE